MDIDKKEEGLPDGPVSHMDGPKKGPDDTQQHEDGANSHHGAVQLRIQQDSEPEVSDAEPDKVSGCFSPLFFRMRIHQQKTDIRINVSKSQRSF